MIEWSPTPIVVAHPPLSRVRRERVTRCDYPRNRSEQHPLRYVCLKRFLVSENCGAFIKNRGVFGHEAPSRGLRLGCHTSTVAHQSAPINGGFS